MGRHSSPPLFCREMLDEHSTHPAVTSNSFLMSILSRFSFAYCDILVIALPFFEASTLIVLLICVAKRLGL